MLATEDQSNTTTTNTAYSSATASEVVQRRREGEAIKDMLPAHKIARGTKSIVSATSFSGPQITPKPQRLTLHR